MCGIGSVERLFPSGALKQAHIPRAVGEPQSGGYRVQICRGRFFYMQSAGA